jgi:hypothetical protein
MDNINRFHVTHKTDCSKLLPDLMYIYSVVKPNKINLAFIQVQVNVSEVFVKPKIQAHIVVNVESQKISLKNKLMFKKLNKL